MFREHSSRSAGDILAQGNYLWDKGRVTDIIDAVNMKTR
jgi:hypothetical protein